MAELHTECPHTGAKVVLVDEERDAVWPVPFPEPTHRDAMAKFVAEHNAGRGEGVERYVLVDGMLH
jgi:hypothetical protein